MNEATYFMNKVPMQLNLWYVLLIDVATIVITVLCMWLPTIYVRKIQPAKVLQFK
jgi:lipoprotein-releasing system permease protein